MNTFKSAATGAFAICSMVLACNSPAHAYNRDIRLYNETSQPIVEFHASNIGTNSWQEDILGDWVLLPGESVLIDLYDGTGYCRFDFKTVFGGGGSLVRRDVNVCEAGAYTVSNR
jgi:hypothetical protein